MKKANHPYGSDSFFERGAELMSKYDLPGGDPVEDRQFTWCPGRDTNPDCDSKVVVFPGDKVNFCCIPCWAAVWAITRDEPGDMPEKPHSTECVWRQERRNDEPVLEGTFTVMTSPVALPSRL
jgi:hypothetical protein